MNLSKSSIWNQIKLEILSLVNLIRINLRSQKLTFVYASNDNQVYLEKIWDNYKGPKQKIFLTYFPGANFIKPRYIKYTKIKAIISGNTGIPANSFSKIPVRIHVPHSTTSLTHIYPSNAFSAFNEIFAISKFQKDEVERFFPWMNCHDVGYMMFYPERKYEVNSDENSVLLAFSWYAGNIFENVPTKLINILLERGFKIDIRPHPGHLIHNREILDKIIDIDPQKIHLDLSLRADFSKYNFMVSDWSGIATEFAFATEQPVVFINSKQKINNYSYDDIYIPFEKKIRGMIGPVCNIASYCDISKSLDHVEFNKRNYKNCIRQLKNEEFFNYGIEVEKAVKLLSQMEHPR